MTAGADLQLAALKWAELDQATRDILGKKLDGLYGYGATPAAFDSIALDKQQAILLLMRRLVALNLWDAVRIISNAYGEGGVGIYFTAWPYLWSTLNRRKDFTQRFARHKDNTGGFLEKTRLNATLHFLYIDEGTDNSERQWHVHFDRYGPWGSPFTTARHLLNEKFLARHPDWRTISAYFQQLDR